jgi:hypothetical protein
MTEYLTKNFINLSNRGFRPNRTAELRFYGREGTFRIASLVIPLHEGFSIELVEVPHVIPKAVKPVVMVSHASRVYLEGNECCATNCLNRSEASSIGVSFISRDLIDCEGLGCSLDKHRESEIVRRFAGCSLDTSNYMGFDSTHKMRLDPSLLASFLAPFMVKPSIVSSSSKSRRIDRKVSFYCSRWTGTFFNERFKQGSQSRVSQIVKYAIIRQSLSYKTFGLQFSQVCHCTSSRYGGIDLVTNSHNDVREQMVASSSSFLHGLDYHTLAQLAQGFRKSLLFVSLNSIIDGPILSVCNSYRLSFNPCPVGMLLSLCNELNRINVLAFPVSRLKMLAGTKRLSIVHVHDVSPIARLGGDLPPELVFLNCVRFRYCQSSFLSHFHFNAPFQIMLTYNYKSIGRMLLSIVFYIKMRKFLSLILLIY